MTRTCFCWLLFASFLHSELCPHGDRAYLSFVDNIECRKIETIVEEEDDLKRSLERHKHRQTRCGLFTS